MTASSMRIFLAELGRNQLTYSLGKFTLTMFAQDLRCAVVRAESALSETGA